MVSLVIVSHSAKLSESIKELANQMSQGKVSIATAGGLDDKTIGTNAERIFEAINNVYQPDGVLILLDLGSAVLSTEIAIQMLDSDKQDKILISEAPILEGAISAAVEASVGSSLKKVDAAARGVVTITKVSGAVPLVKSEALFLTPKEETSKNKIIITISNEIGLHARPAAQFVQTANKFKSNISVRNQTLGGSFISAKSMFSVLSLGALKDHQIEISSDGPDSIDAIKALQKLVESGFGEMEQPIPMVDSSNFIEAEVPSISKDIKQKVSEVDWTMYKLHGIPASDGIEIGPSYILQSQILKVKKYKIKNPKAEWERFLSAINQAKNEIIVIKNKTTKEIGAREADIFTAHKLFLDDHVLLDCVKKQIDDNFLNAEASLAEVVEGYVKTLQGMDSKIFKQRAVDLEDVNQRVLKILLGEKEKSIAELSKPVVLIAKDIFPSDIAQLDKKKILGLCTVTGGTTSHTAILARTLKIPAIVGLGKELLNIPEDTTLIIDGKEGLVIANPDKKSITTYSSYQKNLKTQQRTLKLVAQKPAFTHDGYRKVVLANISNVDTAKIALEYGAEGIGLLRTEFLYIDCKTIPSEEDQYKAYKSIADLMLERPFIIRTLDIGGDKPLPYLNIQQEINPSLGWRGIRFSLDNVDLFKDQIRAILRTSYERNVKIMFPMISNIDEIYRAKAILSEVIAELESRGIPFARDMDIGIMIETPAAALASDILSKEVDFFSIGTNDLIQYTMACDRINKRVAHLYEPFHPVILRLLKNITEAAHGAKKWVSICGKMASNPKAIPILLGLGIDEFSMTATAIPKVKTIIQSLDLSQAQDLAIHVLQLKTAKEVYKYIEEIFPPNRK